MAKFRMLYILICDKCMIAECFFSEHATHYYDECTCAQCGNNLHVANTFGRLEKQLNQLSICGGPIVPSAPVNGAGGRMAILNIDCEEAIPYLKRSKL